MEQALLSYYTTGEGFSKPLRSLNRSKPKQTR